MTDEQKEQFRDMLEEFSYRYVSPETAIEFISKLHSIHLDITPLRDTERPPAPTSFCEEGDTLP